MILVRGNTLATIGDALLVTLRTGHDNRDALDLELLAVRKDYAALTIAAGAYHLGNDQAINTTIQTAAITQ